MNGGLSKQRGSSRRGTRAQNRALRREQRQVQAAQATRRHNPVYNGAMEANEPQARQAFTPHASLCNGGSEPGWRTEHKQGEASHEQARLAWSGASLADCSEANSDNHRTCNDLIAGQPHHNGGLINSNQQHKRGRQRASEEHARAKCCCAVQLDRSRKRRALCGTSRAGHHHTSAPARGTVGGSQNCRRNEESGCELGRQQRPVPGAARAQAEERQLP